MLKPHLFLILSLALALPASAAIGDEDPNATPAAPDPEPVPTLYSKIVVPCDKLVPAGDKCSFLAVYDERDDILYVLKRPKGEEDVTGSLAREDVVAAAQQSFDLVQLYSEASSAVDSSSAFFQLENGVLQLSLQILFVGNTERINKTVTVTY